MARFTRIALALVTLALTAASAPAVDTGHQLPAPEIVDCNDAGNGRVCIECGASTTDGVFCCWEPSNCTVVPVPPPPAPSPGISTRFPTLRKGLGSSLYFRR